MPLADVLLSHTQANYAAPVTQIAERWAELFGEAAFEGVARPQFAAHVLSLLQTVAVAEPLALQVLRDLLALTWWCGLEMEDTLYGVVGDLARSALFDIAGQIGTLPPGPLRAPTVHAVFTEALQSPLHSPSRGAVDYVAALGTLSGAERIDIYHQGAVSATMLDYMRTRLASLGDRVNLIANPGSTALDALVSRGPHVHHVWCEQPLAAHLGIAHLLGPTIMFTCGDEPPYQPADVYWYFHAADHITRAWAAKGAPPSFAANYVQLEAGPNTQARRASAPRGKADLGLGDDQVLLATVGNRLSMDMDEGFVTGMERTLRAHPQAVWLVVGPLPDALSSACRQVLGRQFGHLPFETRLADLLAACDLFVNPFRRGGGDSASLAMANGCPVLTRSDRGDVAAFVPAGHAARDAGGFFAQLAELIEDRDLRGAWRCAQQDRADAMADQQRFAACLQEMIQLAFERYLARRGASLESTFGRSERARAA